MKRGKSNPLGKIHCDVSKLSLFHRPIIHEDFDHGKVGAALRNTELLKAEHHHLPGLGVLVDQQEPVGLVCLE